MRASRVPFVAAVVVALVVGLAAVGVAIHRVAGPDSPPGVPVPLAQATPSATAPASASLAALTDACASKRFAAALPPRDPPANVHVYPAPPAPQIDATKLYLATITTAKGLIVICLEPQLAPKTVNNFVVLARNHFYDGLRFHRVVPDFVIQAGDPKGDGTGGPGYAFADEPVKGAYAVGAVAMANSGPNTNGSQFFICIGSQCPPLPPKYNLFGVVESGLAVADRIAQGDVMRSVTVAQQQ